jgi:hypothetical protein
VPNGNLNKDLFWATETEADKERDLSLSKFYFFKDIEINANVFICSSK